MFNYALGNEPVYVLTGPYVIEFLFGSRPRLVIYVPIAGLLVCLRWHPRDDDGVRDMGADGAHLACSQATTLLRCNLMEARYMVGVRALGALGTCNI